jgi:AcrR family transcriptional regulator
VKASITEQLAGRAVERTVAGRRAEYEIEMRRIVESTFSLIQRTGSLDPSMRDILAESGISTQAFYRYFASKDELMLVLLDEGRRRLLDTLERRMRRADTPADRLRAWIEGVLAQATNPAAAARTRPWVLSERHLSTLFPEEQQSSVDLLVRLLYEPIRGLRGGSGHDSSEQVAALATMVYRLTFATLGPHLVAGTKPTREEVSELVSFCLQGTKPRGLGEYGAR